MSPPSSVGMHKLKAITQHEDVLPHGRSHVGNQDELSFSLGNQKQQTFNVLYVQTPRISVMQAPLFREFMETCAEAAELVKPVLRLGIRETSLFDKCPYYE
jgi:hypothetical protein